mmetsp:Transcript_36458/g.117889  ORF Transcript_36458/g.117889 Transcript_36458/m.117889 type:complete len:112 (+) Transcript_36458:1086-1421(+)
MLRTMEISDAPTPCGGARASSGPSELAHSPCHIQQAMLNAVSILVMATCSIGHSVAAQTLLHLGVGCIDESVVLTVADDDNHVNKTKFKVPFVCGCRNLGKPCTASPRAPA